MTRDWPRWSYFPRNERPADWAVALVDAVALAEDRLSTVDRRTGHVSDDVLRELAPTLTALGYAVETSKKRGGKITRPVLFGDNGVPEVSYDIDAFHDELGIALEVEAGRGAANNADYRDIVRTSLILDARYLALLTPIRYRTGTREHVMPAYDRTRAQLDAVYASRRLVLPFDGLLLLGY